MDTICSLVPFIIELCVTFYILCFNILYATFVFNNGPFAIGTLPVCPPTPRRVPLAAEGAGIVLIREETGIAQI